MVFVFGSRLFGKVDNVKGLFHVATKFGHFDFFPLIPLESWVVISKSGDSFRGVPIPLSGKSILIGWLRAVSIIALVASICVFVATLNDPNSSVAAVPARTLASGRVIPARPASNPGAAVLMMAAAVMAVSAFFVIGCRYVPGIGKASPARIRQIGRHLGLSDEAIDELCRHQYATAPASAFEVLPSARGVRDVATAGR